MKNVLALIMMFVCFTAAANANDCGRSREPSISVIGRAVIELPADQVRISAGIVTRDKNAAAAQIGNMEKVQTFRDFLLKVGICEQDIKTGHVSLRPIYRNRRSGGSDIIAFEAHQSMEAILREPDKYRDLVHGAVDLGLNRIWDISFERSDIVMKYKEARILAVSAAREKAAYLAQAIRQSIGAAIEVEELDEPAANRSFEESMTENLYVFEGGDPPEEALPDARSPDFPRENISIKAAVRVVFRLNPEPESAPATPAETDDRGVPILMQ